MEYRIRTQPEEWACTKFCRIDLNGRSVWQFLLWLCDHIDDDADAFSADEGKEVTWYDPVENTWGWDAPRQRMAKLLWQKLQSASDEEFYSEFSFALPCNWSNSANLLSPIQNRLNWVMQGLVGRREQDDKLGQSEWGERWWLPSEQAQFVREQLKGAHAELIEHSSDYEEAVRHGLSYYVRRSVGAITVPSDDPKRVYLGQRRKDSRVRVWVKDSKGNKYPLKHGDCPYMEADGTGFEWGYGGHGPGALSRCILVDALDGNLKLAEEIDRMKSGFFEKYILKHPREKNISITRASVHSWLKEIGKLAAYEHGRKTVAASLSAHASVVSEREALIGRIQEAGELRSQRFDVVPESFESALYLDLMRMLEVGGAALRCSHCGLPIAYDRSGRANKQRARSKRGQSIYHPECFAEGTRLRKKEYWERRAKSAHFRESERARARAYRKLS